MEKQYIGPNIRVMWRPGFGVRVVRRSYFFIDEARERWVTNDGQGAWFYTIYDDLEGTRLLRKWLAEGLIREVGTED